MANLITPLLVEQWRKEPEYTDGNNLLTRVTMTTDRLMQLCEKSAQHGADQELKACRKWIENCGYHPCVSKDLFAARRPKPPSLKEEALAALDEMSIEPCLINGVDVNAAVRAKYNTIRTALEALPND